MAFITEEWTKYSARIYKRKTNYKLTEAMVRNHSWDHESCHRGSDELPVSEIIKDLLGEVDRVVFATYMEPIYTD